MAEVAFAVRRAVPRFSLVAEAEATGLRDGIRLLGRVSEISARGCYVDTPETPPETLPVGSDVHLRILYGGSTWEVRGKILYTHRGWGMAVLFGDMTAQQRIVLDAWLAELSRKSNSPIDVV